MDLRKCWLVWHPRAEAENTRIVGVHAAKEAGLRLKVCWLEAPLRSLKWELEIQRSRKSLLPRSGYQSYQVPAAVPVGATGLARGHLQGHQWHLVTSVGAAAHCFWLHNTFSPAPLTVLWATMWPCTILHCIRVGVCMCAHTHQPWCKQEGQRTNCRNRFSPSTVWVPLDQTHIVRLGQMPLSTEIFCWPMTFLVMKTSITKWKQTPWYHESGQIYYAAFPNHQHFANQPYHRKCLNTGNVKLATHKGLLPLTVLLSFLIL